LIVGTRAVHRLWTGTDWAGGPVYLGDMHCVIFSDISNNRLLRYDEVADRTTLFRTPSNQANGNARDRRCRLISCEQRTPRVTRTEHNGRITELTANYEGKKPNSPNGVVVDSDNIAWFTDRPTALGNREGWRDTPELPVTSTGLILSAPS